MVMLSTPFIREWMLILLLASIHLVNSLCPSGCRCKPFSVDCSDAALTSVPSSLPSDTDYLDLSANPLGRIETFPNLGRLRMLCITRHSLSEITSNTFRTLKSLRILDLSNNFLETIPIDMAPTSLNALNLAHNSMLTFKNETQPILRSPSLRTLDLSNCRIAHLPKVAFTLLPSLQHLDLSGNILHSLYADIFSSLSALISLNLSKNDLEPLPNKMFQNNPFLTYLNLSGNAWEYRNIKPPNGSIFFRSVTSDPVTSPILISPSLEHLDLSGCRISQLSSDSLSSLPRLRYLSLARTGVRFSGRKAFEKILNLEALDLSYNLFLYINDDLFKNNHKLASLICSKCYFSHISLSITATEKSIHSTSISYLNIAGTDIGGTLINLAKFPSITSLQLSGTGITSVSSTAFSMNLELTDLDISYCEIKDLPQNLFLYNQKLDKINLSGNFLGRHIDENVSFPTTSATYLDLSDCNYQSISKIYFSGLQSLINLNLSGNPLLYWEDDAFTEMSSLKSLDLSRTMIIKIDPNSFLKNSHLESLFLSSVSLGASMLKASLIDKNNTSLSFINIPSLTVLDLSNCGIQHLTRGAFSGVTSLEKLNLSGNGLRSLDLNSFTDYLLNLTFLDLGNNPWRCDCKLSQLRDWWISQRLEPRRHWVICDEPEDLHDHTWEAISNCSNLLPNISVVSTKKNTPEVQSLRTSAPTDPKIDALGNKSDAVKLSTVINDQSNVVNATIISFVKNTMKTTSSPPVNTNNNFVSKPQRIVREPYPLKAVSNHSIYLKRLAKGVGLGFVSVISIVLISSILYFIICRKRYRRLQEGFGTETASAWEL